MFQKGGFGDLQLTLFSLQYKKWYLATNGQILLLFIAYGPALFINSYFIYVYSKFP